jgi:riboflavin kinase/FMN adenylyltransferase
MRIFHGLGEVPADFGPSVVTIGNFDGVHIGHREIMRRVTTIARERGLAATVLTFDPHPARILAPDRAPRLIMTMGQRLRQFEAAGIDAVLLLPFSFEFARLTPDEFAAGVLANTLRARCVLVGEDFRFGYKQAGNIDTLRAEGERLGFEVEPVAAINGRIGRISSSAIRSLIAEGRVSRACRLMGGRFALEGAVVGGQGIGSKKTVPTLNLAPENELLPKTGVYATRTRDEASQCQWRSITNVGYRPTFDGHTLTVETFLLDPPPATAPDRIEVCFLTFVREERRFATPEQLREQILRDIGVTNRFHRRLAGLHVG